MSRNCGLESFQSVVPQLALVSIITVPPLRVRQRSLRDRDIERDLCL